MTTRHCTSNRLLTGVCEEFRDHVQDCIHSTLVRLPLQVASPRPILRNLRCSPHPAISPLPALAMSYHPHPPRIIEHDSAGVLFKRLTSPTARKRFSLANLQDVQIRILCLVLPLFPLSSHHLLSMSLLNNPTCNFAFPACILLGLKFNSVKRRQNTIEVEPRTRLDKTPQSPPFPSLGHLREA